MKLIVFVSLMLLAFTSQAQMYGAADWGAAYRPDSLVTKGGTTNDKKTTNVLSINGGYRLHLISDKGEFNMLTEVNVRIPVLDNTNGLSGGIKTGIMIPLGTAYLVPMAGFYFSSTTAGTAKPVAPAFILRTVFSAPAFDANWYVEASYINRTAGIGIGLIIRENKLFE